MTATLDTNEKSWEEHEPGEDWREYGLCKRNPELFFPVTEIHHERTVNNVVEVTTEEVEPPYPLPEAKQLCDSCPVRPECLEYALANDVPFGTFGGMSGYQRSLIGVKRSRKHCPGCGSDQLVDEGRNEICVACGISWDAGLLG